jgi:hypothetical protein
MKKYFMRRALVTGLNTSVQKFLERLNDLNPYLLLFLEEYTKLLGQEEINKILN